MYTFLLVSLFFLPIFYAERYQTQLDIDQELFVPRSAAASYLCMYLKEKKAFSYFII